MNPPPRLDEWFVPKFGPLKFRIICGMLFLPYTGMCISFVILGCLISPRIYFERVIAISLIYFMALGIAAHVADNMGSKKIKPWGNFFTKRQSWIIIICCLLFSYTVGFYYAINYSPLLIIIGIIEGFFLFSYNFELFNGFFHTNIWFAISWGVLPFFAGFVIQTNTITPISLSISMIPFVISYVEIKISRTYKKFKINNSNSKKIVFYETILKILSIGTILITSIIFTITEFL